jgi:hypothetical protein
MTLCAMPECWFKRLPDAGPCEGQRIVKCHLVTRQELRNLWRKFHHRAATDSREPWPWPEFRSLQHLVDDPRTWVWGCGLSSAHPGHHGQFKPDGPKGIPLSLLPEGYTRLMAELGLWWYVERTFNRRSSFNDLSTSTVDGAAGFERTAQIARRLHGEG